MKKILAILLCAALTASLCACENSEAELEYSAITEENAAGTAAFVPTPVFIDDIHEWADGNCLYNINGTYDNYERQNAKFASVNSPAELWRGVKNAPALGGEYDRSAAAGFAKLHWNDDLDLCAPFVSRCLNAGGLSISTDSSTSLCLMLLNSRLGFGEFIPINPDRTVTLPDYAKEGDIVENLCPYEGLMIHSMIYVGDDEYGNMKVCCHNEENSGKYTYLVAEECKDCTTPINEVFFYHFISEGELLPKSIQKDGDVLLFENTGYAIPKQSYSSKNAAEYARENPLDGIGQFGAEHTSRALSAGGLSVGYPVQSALFFQLMKSRLGEMQSIAINPDRTITLPNYVKEGDVCFLYCPREGIMYSSFIIKGADSDGKMLAYSYDKVNDDAQAFRVENICPGSKCGGEIKDAIIYHFD